MNATGRADALRWLAARLPQALLSLLAFGLMLRTDRFFSQRNLELIVELASIVGVLAVGQSLVLLGGGFDLSQGAVVALSAAVAALLCVEHAWHPLAAGAASLALGGLIGTVNGAFVAFVRTSAFVTTLSATLIVRGLTFAVLGGRQIGGVEGFDALARAANIGGARVSWLSLVFAVVVAAAWVLTAFTVRGRHLYAVGGNERAAYLSGLPTGRLRVLTYALSSMSAALGALMLLGFVGVARADTGAGYELKAIAACVLGGVSLQGGRGSVLGAALGCVLLQAIANLINLARLPDEYSTLVTGGVILLFTAADALGRRRP